MLNSVATTRDRPRVRMTQADRRRQLLGIGLRKLVERPIQDLSLDEVADEAGISRSLLFHYFPTKGDYHDEVLGAATRRMLRNTAPDREATPEEALEQFVSRFFAQVERRRSFYLALVFGSGALSLGGNRVESFRMSIARRLLESQGLPESALPVLHAWSAYVEDRALQWSASADRAPLDDEVAHCTAGLAALLEID